jgi:nucleotide sugar dehydrogenase
MRSPIDLVVMGLGYVGLPLASEAVRCGLHVVGLDLDAAKVAALNNGRSHVDDLTDREVADLLEQGFTATTDEACLADAEAAVICVPTPLAAGGGPDLGAVTGAATTVAGHLQQGMLVVLESTTYPGTTEDVVRPILERGGLRAGVDFHLAYSPERIDPGNENWTFRTTPKVVSGVTPRCRAVAEMFYGKLVDTVVPTRSTREAEMAKLLENTYRHVNIALVNEMSVFCDELGIDLWDAIAAASTKPFGFQAFRPGAGVGGHCIPIDPNYLSYRVRLLGYPFRFVELAQEVNARMPAYVASRAQRLLNARRKSVNGSKVALLGVTYKPDIADSRGSPAQPLARRLLELGADLCYHDPHVDTWAVSSTVALTAVSLGSALSDADLVIVLQLHAEYRSTGTFDTAALVLDTSGRIEGQQVERL